MKWWRGALVGLGLGVLLVACGGGGGGRVEAGEYVRGVCTAMTNWQSDIEDRALELGDEVGSTTDPRAARDTLVGFLTGVEGATDTMLGRIDQAGVPDVEQGADIARDLRSALGGVGDVFSDARQRAGNLPVASQAELAQAVDDLFGEIETQLEEATSAFDRLDERYPNASLNEALEREPACAGLREG